MLPPSVRRHQQKHNFRFTYECMWYVFFLRKYSISIKLQFYYEHIHVSGSKPKGPYQIDSWEHHGTCPPILHLLRVSHISINSVQHESLLSHD